MTFQNLDNLVAIGSLKAEPGDQKEIDGLILSGQSRLKDAELEGLSPESRFDLAYNAAHALCLAALRWHGYRSDNRYMVFQCLPHTLGVGAEVWKVLALCHGKRNRGEYEGELDVPPRLTADLIQAAKVVLEAVLKLERLP